MEIPPHCRTLRLHRMDIPNLQNCRRCHEEETVHVHVNRDYSWRAAVVSHLPRFGNHLHICLTIAVWHNTCEQQAIP